MANISHFTQTVNGVSTTYDIHDANAVDLTSNQTVAGDKEFTGTTTAHDVIPSATDTYNFGSPSYQWNNAYIKSLTINGVECGDILTHNVSEFVDVSGEQTIGGVKTFSNAINNKRAQQFIFNKEYSDATDAWLAIQGYLDKNSTRIGFYSIGDFSGNRGFRWFVRGQSTNSVEVDLFGFGRKGNETSYMYINAPLETDLIPTNNNSKSLGTSTNKWKSFNGINPGALSLPSTTLINVASSITALDGTTINKFTPQVDGWLLINGTGTANDGYIYAVQGRIGMMSANNTTSLRCAVLIPVMVGVEVSVTCKLTTLTWANIATCQGNV